MSTMPVVIFDCDGVLLDSNELKSDCFRETLQAAGASAAAVERFITFQRANFGMSRYRLFAHFRSSEADESPGWDAPRLVDEYARRLRPRYAVAPLTQGAGARLQALATRATLAVVSGSDQAELREVLGGRDDLPRFEMVLGSPTTKIENLAAAVAALLPGRPPAEALFIGDAEADWRAAEAVGTRFIYMDHYSTAQARMRALAAEHDFPVIADLRDLPD